MTTDRSAAANGPERVSVPLERLQSNFVVSMRELLRRPESEARGKDEEDEAEVDDEHDFAADQDRLSECSDSKGTVPKRERGAKKAPKLEDYDVEDPFIDDSEMTAVYESVFDLMLRAEQPPGEDDEGVDAPQREHSTEQSKRALTVKDFYVYRGPIEVELMEREFDEPRKKKKKKAKKLTSKRTDREDEQDRVASSQPSVVGKKSDRKTDKKSDKTPDKKSDRKSDKQNVKAPDKKTAPSLTERLQQLEAEIEEREGKANDVAMNDEPDEDSKAGNVRRSYDLDKEIIRLEVLDAFEKFKEAAAKVSEFDPTKFPTALRSSLERYTIACLKRDNDVLEEEALARVSSLVPYSALALRRLLLKKIFPLLIESLGQVRPEIIRTRIREEVDAVLSADTADGETVIDPVADDPRGDDSAKRSKKRKWSMQLKQLVFEYLKCASDRSLLLRAVRANSDDPAARPVPSSLSETALRRSAYRELVGCWLEDKWPMTSSELSRECSAWKKRHERTLLKDHNVDIEQFLVVVEKPERTAVGTSDSQGGPVEQVAEVAAPPSDPPSRPS